MATPTRTLMGASCWLILLGVTVLAGCAETPSEDEGASDLAPLEIGEETIRGADGRELFTIGSAPANIRVDADSEFGVAQRFTDASLSPAGGWLALTTAGAAHGAGWLLSMEEGEAYPAAFQYGGSVVLGPWHDDGQRMVFAEEGPAPTRTLVVVTLGELGVTVSENASSVRLPEHAERVPPGTEYHAVEWREDTLILEVDGQRWRHDPASGETIAME